MLPSSFVLNVDVDRAYTDRLAIIPPPVREVGFILLIVAVKRVFSSLLQVVNIPTDHVFRDFGYVINFHLLLAPAFKQPQGLFITVHRLLPQLPAAAVDHVFINPIIY